MAEDFSKYPQSIGERRSDASGKGCDWTPREALIALLREIDSGAKNIDALIICYRHAGNMAGFYNATPDSLTTVGLLELTKFRIHEGAENG